MISTWLRKRSRESASRLVGQWSRRTPNFQPVLSALEDRWVPATVHVTSPTEANLFAALAIASPGDTVDFQVAPGSTIDLSSQNPLGSGSFFVISKNLTIDATSLGAAGVNLHRLTGAATSFRIFEVTNNATVSFKNLTFTNGAGDGGGALLVSSGAAVVNGSTFTGNSSSAGGGAIASEAGTQLTVTTSSFSGNAAGTNGGAIDAQGTLAANFNRFVNDAVPPPQSEVQTVTLTGAGMTGSFTLSGLGVSTTVTVGDGASTVENNLRAALTANNPSLAGSVSVSGSTNASGGSYNFTFVGALANADVDQFTVTPTTLTGGTVSAATFSQGSGNEVQSLTFAGTAGGSFTVSFGGPTSPAQTFTTTTATSLQTAVESLVGVGNAVVAGTNAAGYRIFYRGALAKTDVPQIQVQGSGLIPANSAITATVANGGGTGAEVFAAGAAEVEDNWWGVNTGPGANAVVGAAAAEWLTLVNTASPPAVFVGGSTTFTASISGLSTGGTTAPGNLTGLPSFPNPAGTVFSNPVGGTLSGSGTQFVDGFATTTFTATAGGARSVAATADGQTVTGTVRAGTSVSVTSSANPSVFGQPVLFTATVTPDAGSGPIPTTDTVTFTFDGIAYPPVFVDAAGRASFDPQAATGAPLGAGPPHTLHVDFSGDANFGASSTDLSPGQSVNRADTTVTVTSSLNPSVVGQSVTFTANVRAVAPGSGTPTGTVIFIIDGTPQPTSPPLAGGQTVLTVSSLGAGPHTVQVNYSGDANFNVSTGTLPGGQAVNQAPVITSAAPPTTATVGNAYSYTLTATGTPTPALSASGLPGWLTFTPGTGVLTGTPALADEGATGTITLTAANGITPDATVSFTITVSGPPTITSASSATFTAGTSGTFTVTAAGVPNPSFGTASTLPTGVTLSAAGLLSGVPTQGGTFPLTITASNGFLPDATQDFTLTVNQAPTITSAATATFTLGTAAAFVVTTAGFPVAAVSEAGALPNGLHFTDNGDGTATISGTPVTTPAGDFSLTLTAANGIGGPAVQAFTLTVVRPPKTQIAAGAGPGGRPEVRVFESGSPQPVDDFLAFAPTFGGGVRTALGDVNGDGTLDIIAAPGPGGGPEVKVFDGRDHRLLFDFFAYSAAFSGGVFVSAGDVNGDGRADVITGAGAGGAPHVEVFSGADGSLLRSFFAYSVSFIGGVTVAAGDVDGDGRADVITGAGAGGAPHVQVFDGQSGAVIRSFFAYSPTFTGGVFVAAGDVDGDGLAEVITGAGAGGAPHVEVFRGTDGSRFRSFFAFAPDFAGGVTVAAGDQNGDGRADIVTGAGAVEPAVRVFDGLSLAASDGFDADVSDSPFGVFVG